VPHRIGLLVAKFCALHKDELDNCTFKELCCRVLREWTEEKVETCLQMIQVEKHINSDTITVESQPTDFQVKCACNMSLEWKQILRSPETQTTLQTLNLPAFQILLQQKCLERSACESETFLDALANSGSLPATITVSGAGTSCVNGVYAREVDFDSDDAAYVMDGFYKEKAITFSLQWFHTLPGKFRMWYITVKSEDTDDTDFYRTAAFADAPISNFPPKSGACWCGATMYHFMIGEGDGPTLTSNFSADN